MSAGPLRIAPSLALVLLLMAFGPRAFGDAPYGGRPVRAVLEELQRAGLNLVYNDSLVPGSLLVAREPKARSGPDLLNEILEPHGLATRHIGPDTWVIVAAGKPAAAPPRAAGSGRRRGTALEEVIVTASQYGLAHADAVGPRTFLTQAELRSLPKLADEPLRAVHRLPGAASNGLSGLAHMRGGEENETQILLDGMPLTEPFHLKNFFSPVSVLDAEIVDSMDVYAGGFPADYGDRMSAVVDARSIDPPADGGYALGLSLFHLNGLAADNFAGNRGRVVASARRSNLAEVMKLGDTHLGEPRYLDTFLKAEYDLSDDTAVAAHALFVDDRIRLNNTDETEFASSTNRSVHLWTTAQHRWSDELTGRALLAWTSVDNDRSGTIDEPGNRTGAVEDSRDSRSGLMKLELEKGDDDFRWRAGLDASWSDASYAYDSTLQTAPGYPYPNSEPLDIVRRSRVKPQGWETSAFVATRWRLTGTLTGELGLRWDNQTYDGVDGGTQLSPRANLLYDYSAATQIRASWGRFYQAQGINELQVEDGVDVFLPAQSADHFILSVEHAFTDEVSARVEAYYKDYDELKPRFENLFDPLVLLPELETDRVGVAPMAGTVRGIEFLVHDRSARPWGWWLSYSWSDTEETVDGGEVARSWDQRHAVNGGINWTEGPWDIALAGTWHTGWPTTPATLAPPAVPGGEPGVIIGARNSARLDDFRSLDLRAGYTFDIGDTELLAFFELINMLGLKNPCCVEYTVRDAGTGDFRLERDFDYWPRFVPNLGVLWKF
jgi:outer membrane receptor protein involved in Fe transport